MYAHPNWGHRVTTRTVAKVFPAMHDFSRNPFKPLNEMTPEDWRKLGFKGGLEIHQQIKTERKLFCRCPAGKYTSHHEAEVLRHMRPTLSELGEYDGCALMEFKTKKEIIYLLHPDTVCTYELDDAPPFEIDSKAVDIALKIGFLLNLNLVDEIHIARKQYLDGSIPTGFQRTTILGVDGHIKLGGREIGIRQLGLEEDSCREVRDAGHRIWFRTDRLGMPLIEMVTEPQLYTPQEVQQAGELLRELVRSTHLVRTGRGATRQDVNISIEGGTRIEIKGVDSLNKIPRLVYNEAMRQWNLLRIQHLLKQRGVTPETFNARDTRVTHIIRDTEYLPLKSALEKGWEVAAVRLENFGGILSESTQTRSNFGREISDRVRVVACLDGFPNMIHSDTLEPTISHSQWNKVRKRLRGRHEDSFVVVWGPPEDLNTAVKEIIARAQEAMYGVPSETRQAMFDGNNGFERILPGPNRMYPDTDLPPIVITDERRKRACEQLPEPPWDIRARYEKIGLPEDVMKKLVRSPWGRAFDEVLAQEPEIPIRSLGCRLAHYGAYALRKKGFPEKITVGDLRTLIEAIGSGQMQREAMGSALLRFMMDEKISMEQAIAPYIARGDERERLEPFMKQAVDQLGDCWAAKKDARLRRFMEPIMKEFLGRVPVAQVYEKLSAIVE